MIGPCNHARLRKENQPCKLHNADPANPLCCWAQCADCGGMLHMVRVPDDHALADDEVVGFLED